MLPTFTNSLSGGAQEGYARTDYVEGALKESALAQDYGICARWPYSINAQSIRGHVYLYCSAHLRVSSTGVAGVEAEVALAETRTDCESRHDCLVSHVESSEGRKICDNGPFSQSR